MKKLKAWEIILLIIFWPIGIIYLIFFCISQNKQMNNSNQKQAETIFNLNQEINSLREIINKFNNENITISSLKKEKDELKKEIKDLEKEVIVKSCTIPFDEHITSQQVKNELAVLKTRYNEYIKSDNSIIIKSYDNKKTINNNIKQLLRCFNSETTALLTQVTVTNVDNIRTKIQKTYETLNKIFETDGIKLNEELLKYKFEELNLIYNYQEKIQQEKKAIKEQMLEEEKVRREIEREKQKLEKEKNQFSNEITKLMKYMQKATDIEKQLYIDKIKELEEKLKLLEKDMENVLEREQNTRAGFVYIISNIGSFGENIYKIGMTRRLEPMDRIKELSDASVPFEFDVHAMIFSEDAPALENILHSTFEKNQVNRINKRKEFFNVSLDEIEKVVKENFNSTVTFTKIAEATQYRETLKILANENN